MRQTTVGQTKTTRSRGHAAFLFWFVFLLIIRVKHSTIYFFQHKLYYF